MIRTSFTALTFAAIMAGCSIGAQADDSTGPTNPAPKGAAPSSVGVPTGTGKGMPNGNTDGSAAPTSPGTSGADISPQKTGTAEGNLEDGTTNKAGTSTNADGKGNADAK